MPWVSRNSYNPGQRHYVEGVERVFTSEPLPRPHVENDALRYQQFVDTATSLTLCSRIRWRGASQPRKWMESGYLCTYAATGKLAHKSGGLSVKEKVNLMQRNLCATCIKEYFKVVRPDLANAYMELKNGRLEVSG